MKSGTISVKEFLKICQKKGFYISQYKNHPILVLTDLNGKDTPFRVKMFNIHKGPKGEINSKSMAMISSQLGLHDKKFLEEYRECLKTQSDLLERLISLKK